MEEQASLLRAVSALSSYFIGDTTMQETLTRVSELARDTIPGSDAVGLTLFVENRPGTYVFTDPEIPAIDLAQYETEDGPCLKSYSTGHPVILSSTRTSDEFPKFCEVALSHGILSMLSLPMITPTGTIGAMNHYSRTENSFGPAEAELGLRFAEQASFLLVNAQPYWDARTLVENLRQAIDSRANVEQARGIVMARTGLDGAAAFEQLIEQSRTENVKLRDVASRVVSGSRRETT